MDDLNWINIKKVNIGKICIYIFQLILKKPINKK